jgi:hypothetical protein
MWRIKDSIHTPHSSVRCDNNFQGVYSNDNLVKNKKNSHGGELYRRSIIVFFASGVDRVWMKRIGNSEADTAITIISYRNSSLQRG